MDQEIRVVVFRENDGFVAQALEIDIAAQGATPEQAFERLKVTFRAELREAECEKRDISEIGPAPASFHAMFEDDVVMRELLKAA